MRDGISEITSLEDIQALVLEDWKDWKKYGHVTVKKYEDFILFNYNVLAQYEAKWNFFECVSRGLIIHCKTGEIVARPFDKFFHWMEGGRKTTSAIVTVTEKMDGSLGILFRVSEREYRIATRGSFTSPQAQWATDFLRAHFTLSDLPTELTLLFEIIYPENRILIDYGTKEDLVLLAARNRFTGSYLPFFPDVCTLAHQCHFSLPKVYSFSDMSEILAQIPKLGAEKEGYVVEFSDSSRYKCKGEQYKELQKMLLSLSFKNTLQVMQSGTLPSLLEKIPDEFLEEVRGWIQEIQNTLKSKKTEMEAIFAFAPQTTRKEFAQWVHTYHPKNAPYLFALFSGKKIDPLIYKYHDWPSHENE